MEYFEPNSRMKLIVNILLKERYFFSLWYFIFLLKIYELYSILIESMARK